MRQEETAENLNLGSRNGMLRGKRRLEVPWDIHSVPYWESYPGSFLAELRAFPGALPVTGTSVSVNRTKADGFCLVGPRAFPCLTSVKEGCFMCLLF